MIPDISNPLYTEMVRGRRDICGIYNYNIILSNTDFFSPKIEHESPDVLIEKQCDGIIYIAKISVNSGNTEKRPAKSFASASP